jgi:ergothioneine biosynthesis protein EgtB
VFDNEGPAHRVFLEPFSLSSSLVTVGALRAFIDDGGYNTPSLWLAAGYEHQRSFGRRTPLYVRRRDDDGALVAFTVAGDRVLHDDEPATHLSYFEADALARFLGARLPTEFEWEAAAIAGSAGFEIDDDGRVPSLLPASGGHGFFGVAWQWTRSSYQAYPGYQPAAGVVGEYNGKFMVDQMVLRGSSSYTPRGHSRLSYRNFWPASTSFQNSGLRLARDRH